MVQPSVGARCLALLRRWQMATTAARCTTLHKRCEWLPHTRVPTSCSRGV
jgi:hypothetical protein